MSTATDALTSAIDNLTVIVNNQVAVIEALPGADDALVSAQTDRINSLATTLGNAKPSAVAVTEPAPTV